MSDEFRKNLMGPEPTLLPAETEVYQQLDAGQEALDLVEKHPTSSLLWAVLAEEAWAEGRTIDSYAYSRVGYHRGLDSLRRNGWRGVGPDPVGARTQPRLPARPVLAGPCVRGHRRGRGAGAHREVPEGLGPGREGSHRSRVSANEQRGVTSGPIHHR